MEIDILPTDTFTVDTEGHASIRQVRDGQWRALGRNEWYPPTDYRNVSLTRDLFISIARAAGHTIREVTPEPEPFVSTHCVVWKSFNIDVARGSKADCERYANAHGSSTYEVRPLPKGVV